MRRGFVPSAGTRHNSAQLEETGDGSATSSCRESGDQSADTGSPFPPSQRDCLVRTLTTASRQPQCPVRKATRCPLGDQARSRLGATPLGTSVLLRPPCGEASDNEQQRRGGLAGKPEHRILSPLGDQIGVPPHSLSGCRLLPSAEAVQTSICGSVSMNTSRFPSGDRLGK